MMQVYIWYYRTIGEIIEEDLKDPGIALALKESQISQCVAHSTNSLLWGMDYLENNIDKHPNYRIKVKTASIRFNFSVRPKKINYLW